MAYGQPPYELDDPIEESKRFEQETGIDDQEYKSLLGLEEKQARQRQLRSNDHGLAEIAKKPSEKGNAQQAKFQGDIGEGVMLREASERLDLLPDPRFDQPYHGFDAVCRDSAGNLVIVESKFADDGINAVRKGQMQVEWVEREAQRLQNPASTAYTEGNREIGEEIQRIGADRVRRVVIAANPKSLETVAYEGQEDGTWKSIDTWSALQFPEQGYSY